MASSAAPNGAEPVDTLSASGSFPGKILHLPIAASYGTAIFYGDFVKCVDTGTVDKSATTNTFNTGTIGIFVGCKYTDPTTNQPTYSQYWPASNAATDAVAYVADDPFLLFRMQANGSLAATTLFNNIEAIDTAGDTNIGRSKNALNASTAATTSTLPLRIVEFVDGPDSSVGDSFTDVIVTWLPGKHAYLTTTGV